MRVGHLQPSRPEWYDRSPSVVLVVGSASITGVSGSVVAAAYTVPSGRKAYIEAAQLDSFRTADGTPNIRVLFSLRVTALLVTANICRLDSSVSNYGPIGDQWVGQAGILLEGNTLDIVYNITATDGTVALNAGAKLVEYDA